VFVFFKFCISGLTGVLINFSSTYLFKDILCWNKYLSNSLALFIALLINYFMNRAWTFEAYSDYFLIQLLKFSIIIFISMFFNHVIVYFCHRKLNLDFYLSKIFAVFLVFFWNYFMHLNFTFQ